MASICGKAAAQDGGRGGTVGAASGELSTYRPRLGPLPSDPKGNPVPYLVTDEHFTELCCHASREIIDV